MALHLKMIFMLLLISDMSFFFFLIINDFSQIVEGRQMPACSLPSQRRQWIQGFEKDWEGSGSGTI
jgi:hypothetical protein